MWNPAQPQASWAITLCNFCNIHNVESEIAYEQAHHQTFLALDVKTNLALCAWSILAIIRSLKRKTSLNEPDAQRWGCLLLRCWHWQDHHGGKDLVPLLHLWQQQQPRPHNKSNVKAMAAAMDQRRVPMLIQQQQHLCLSILIVVSTWLPPLSEILPIWASLLATKWNEAMSFRTLKS